MGDWTGGVAVFERIQTVFCFALDLVDSFWREFKRLFAEKLNTSLDFGLWLLVQFSQHIKLMSGF